MQKDIDSRKLKIRAGSNVDYDFSDYKTFKELFRDLYYRKLSIDEAERKQSEFDAIIAVLKKKIPKKPEYI